MLDMAGGFAESNSPWQESSGRPSAGWVDSCSPASRKARVPKAWTDRAIEPLRHNCRIGRRSRYLVLAVCWKVSRPVRWSPLV